MNEYYGVTRTDEYLEHWGLSLKGGTKAGHKYIARFQIGNGKWRYIYTPAEYAAYLRGKAGYAARRAKSFLGDVKSNGRGKIKDSRQITDITQSRARKERAKTGETRPAPKNGLVRNNRGILNGSKGEHQWASSDFSGKGRGNDTSLASTVKRFFTKSNTKSLKSRHAGGTTSIAGKARDQGRKATKGTPSTSESNKQREALGQHRKKGSTYLGYNETTRRWQRTDEGNLRSNSAQAKTVRRKIPVVGIPTPLTKTVTPFDRTPQKETKRKSKRSRK